MVVIKKIEPITIEEFMRTYKDTRCQFHNGDVWDEESPDSTRQAQSAPDHSYVQFCIGKVLGSLFHRSEGPQGPGGWWFFDEVAVKYGQASLFIHDLAGWKRARLLERPRRYPISERTDWVCEILSTHSTNDRNTKKATFHAHEVPYYWIVEPQERSISVFEWSEKGYVSILDVTEGFVGRIPPFDAVELKANVLFGEE